MTSGIVVAPLAGVSMLTVGQYTLVPQWPLADGSQEVVLLPSFVYVVMRTLTGPALTVAPKFRIGGNATHDDVAPLFTVPLGVQRNVFAQLPLAAFPMSPVDLRTRPAIFEVVQAGVGPTACAGDVLLVGIQVSE